MTKSYGLYIKFVNDKKLRSIEQICKWQNRFHSYKFKFYISIAFRFVGAKIVALNYVTLEYVVGFIRHFQEYPGRLDYIKGHKHPWNSLKSVGARLLGQHSNM